MKSSSIKRLESLIIALLICVPAMLAQESGVSPYSRFGIGDPGLGSYTPNFGMGGLSIGVVDRVHINPNNPATLPFLSSPGFDIGMIGGNETASNSTQTVTNAFGRLDHFALGMPFSKGNWALAFGIQPFSTISYKGEEESFIAGPDITQTNEYTGQGGLNKLNLSLARKLTFKNDSAAAWNVNHLCLGATMNYYFGSNSLTRSAIFPASSGYMNTRIENTTNINDVSVQGSALYRFWVNKKDDRDDHTYSILNLGLVGDYGGNLDGRRSQDAYSYIGTTGQLEFDKDSIQSFNDREGFITLPSSIGIGSSMEFYYKVNKKTSRYRKVRIGVDYRMSNWSEFAENFGNGTENGGLANSSALIFGAEYTPSVIRAEGARVPLFPVGTYRIGARMSDTHLIFDNEQLTEYGISFGASFPILTGGLLKTDTKVSFGIEYGGRGTTDNGLISEQFTRVMVGFSFHPDKRFDRWFQRSKYD